MRAIHRARFHGKNVCAQFVERLLSLKCDVVFRKLGSGQREQRCRGNEIGISALDLQMLQRGCGAANGLFIAPAVRADKLLRDDYYLPGSFVIGTDFFEAHALLEAVAHALAKHLVLFCREATDNFFRRHGRSFGLICWDGSGTRHRCSRAQRAGLLRMCRHFCGGK